MWKRSAAETRLGQISAVKRVALWHEEEEEEQEEEGPPTDPAHQSIISVHFEPVTGIPFQTELVWGSDSFQNHTQGSNKGLYAVWMLSYSIYAEVYIFKMDGSPECLCNVADICTVTAQHMPYLYA